MTAGVPGSATLATPPTRPDARSMSAEQRRNTWLLGLDMAIQLGWLPQLFFAGKIERSARKWPWVTRFSTVERLP